jgi:hypothetical protein
MLPRDRQRSKVYSWEKKCNGQSMLKGTMTMEEVEQFTARVWRAERGRYGRAKVPVPTIGDGRRRGRAGAGVERHIIKMPKWTRNHWQVLHELAHLLTPNAEAHGGRFVGVLIGLAARWLDANTDFLLAEADAMGVRVHRTSIGAVPAKTLAEKMLRFLPGSPTEIASAMNVELGLDVTFRQIQGASIGLVRRGLARWRGPQLTLSICLSQRLV